jgi:hypothetical protein
MPLRRRSRPTVLGAQPAAAAMAVVEEARTM